MSAGESARREAHNSLRHAADLAEAAAEQHRRAKMFERGGVAEERTARLLGELAPYDFHALHDRAWPGTTASNIDHVVVGPSGVFIVDTKNWSAEVRIEGDRLYRGEAPCDDVFEKLQAQAEIVRDLVADLGLPPLLVKPICALHGSDLTVQTVASVWVVGAEQLPRAILRHSKALTQSQVESVLGLLMVALPPAGTAPSSTPVPPSELQDPVEVVDQTPLFTSNDLEQDALAAAMQKPFADWMVFLHPAQSKYVKRDFAGPGRVTGGAGTGKTVVALHRLAYLAERGYQRLLYVTFVRTVPLVLSHSYARFSPQSANRVEFASLHSWAAKFLHERRLPAKVDVQGCDNAYALAWSRLASREVLEASAPYSYWREEVDTVIRGRDLRILDDYLVLNRVGRGSRLGHVQRRAVWQLSRDYADNLQRSGCRDWNDLLRLARDEVRRQPPDPKYDAIVLDEAQDMPRLAAELLMALSADRNNGLLFVGDDQQRVFPGGFTLSECGIDVSGRSVRFTENYRNTREVLATAAALLLSSEPVLDDSDELAPSTASRTGQPSVVVSAASAHEHDIALTSSLVDWQTRRRSTQSAAVLVERNAQVQHVIKLLQGAGVEAQSLVDWDGRSHHAVLVGTTKRAKGLEFSRVHVAYVENQLLGPAPESNQDAVLEQWQRRRREVYVGMTRARDELWVGVLDPTDQTARAVAPEMAEIADQLEGESDTTVYGIIQTILGSRPEGGPTRFSKEGWSYEGIVPALQCENCHSTLHTCRKPYQSAGKEYRYWAVICPECLTATAPNELNEEHQKVLRKFR